MKYVKELVSRLTLLSWVLVFVALVGLVFLLVNISGGDDSKTTGEPSIDESTGLVENIEDLPPVSEDEDETGEILPPEDNTSASDVDISADELESVQ